MGAVDCAFSGVGQLAARLETRFRGQVVCIDDEPQICVGQHLDGLTQERLIASTFLATSLELTCFVASFLIDVGGVDLLVALTLGVLFTVTRTVILETKVIALKLLLLVVYPS